MPAPRAEPATRADESPATAPPAATPAAGSPEREAPAAPGTVGLAKYEPAAAPQASPAADSPGTKPAGQPVQGTAIKEEPFSVWLQSVSPIPAGSAATVEAVLVANAPYHCNAEYPHKFKLAAAPAGLSYPETTVKGAKVTAERSVLPIAVRAQAPGKAKVAGTLSFSVCDDERCLVEKRELSVELEVK